MGRVSLHGIIPLTYTRDHPGPIARDALDAAIMLQAMAGPDRLDPRTMGQPPLPDLVSAATPVERSGRSGLRWPTRIGLLPGYLDDTGESDEEFEPPNDRPGRPPGDEPSRASQVARGAERRRIRREAEVAARRAMVDRFRELGAEIVEVALPDDWEVLTSRAFNNVRLPERSEPFLEHLRRDVRDFGVSLSPWINGLLLPGAEYLRGQRARMLLLERVLDGIFDQCDVVVQTQPFPFDMIGLPLIGFPIGLEAESAGTPLPLGAMLGGQPWAEDRLLSVVAGYQAVTDWHRRRAEDPDRAQESGGEGPPQPPDRGRIDASDVMDLAE
jgi:Asp-tRNA(Asn)/Glu-tRNA(Gln) amidotransferase A subunit family amidase